MIALSRYIQIDFFNVIVFKKKKCKLPAVLIHLSMFCVHSEAGKGGGKLEMLSNVKGQMSSWIGSVQVPSVPSIFSKGGEAGAGEVPEAKTDSPTSGESVKGSPEMKEEDDNSRYRYISLFCV